MNQDALHIDTTKLSDDFTAAFVAASVTTMVECCHGIAFESGWWGTADGVIPDPRSNPLCFSNKLCLVHSELSEAMEGDRKNLYDDKLPQYKMRDVELADAAIRIFDMAGAFGIPLGEILVAKLKFNTKRKDHTPEARVSTGGKTY